MNMPDEVREVITAALLEKQARLLANYPNVCAADANMIMDALDWIDAQPAAPEPDWSQAPDWARWWAADSDGESTYYAERPEPDEKIACWDSARWSAKGSTILSEWDKTSPLPLGVDWRTTLRKRPEATND